MSDRPEFDERWQLVARPVYYPTADGPAVRGDSTAQDDPEDFSPEVAFRRPHRPNANTAAAAAIAGSLSLANEDPAGANPASQPPEQKEVSGQVAKPVSGADMPTTQALAPTPPPDDGAFGEGSFLLDELTDIAEPLPNAEPRQGDPPVAITAERESPPKLSPKPGEPPPPQSDAATGAEQHHQPDRPVAVVREIPSGYPDAALKEAVEHAGALPPEVAMTPSDRALVASAGAIVASKLTHGPDGPPSSLSATYEDIKAGLEQPSASALITLADAAEKVLNGPKLLIGHHARERRDGIVAAASRVAGEDFGPEYGTGGKASVPFVWLKAAVLAARSENTEAAAGALLGFESSLRGASDDPNFHGYPELVRKLRSAITGVEGVAKNHPEVTQATRNERRQALRRILTPQLSALAARYSEEYRTFDDRVNYPGRQFARRTEQLEHRQSQVTTNNAASAEQYSSLVSRNPSDLAAFASKVGNHVDVELLSAVGAALYEHTETVDLRSLGSGEVDQNTTPIDSGILRARQDLVPGIATRVLDFYGRSITTVQHGEVPPGVALLVSKLDPNRLPATEDGIRVYRLYNAVLEQSFEYFASLQPDGSKPRAETDNRLGTKPVDRYLRSTHTTEVRRLVLEGYVHQRVSLDGTQAAPNIVANRERRLVDLAKNVNMNEVPPALREQIEALQLKDRR